MQLLYPWFLLGLGSVIAPIAIHLLQLRRPERVLFTNNGIIREIELITTKQRNLQYLLLLLVRVLALVALVIAFCQPIIPATKTMTTSNAAMVNVLVDNSFSMQRPARTGSAFEAAVHQARSLPGIHPTAQFQLIAAGKRGNSVSYQNNLSELRESGGVASAAKMKAALLNSEVRGPLYILSDFQHSTFDANLLVQSDSTREVVLMPVIGKSVSNAFVDSVWFDEAFLQAQTNIALHIRVKNGGDEPVVDCPVKVFLGPQQAAAFRTTVPSGQSTVTVVQVQLPNQNQVNGRVVTEDAPIVFDNTYYFTAQAATAIRVVEIGPLPIAQELYKNEPLFNYTFNKPENANYALIRQANLVILREASTISSGLRDAIREVVARGGSVAIVPPSATNSREAYQQLFQALGTGLPQWEVPNASPEMREVVLPNVREPFFCDVLGPQSRVAAMPHVAPILRWPRTGTDILRLRDGESYLAEFNSGIGKVYVFSAPFSKEYSDFTSHVLFVPVMYKLAMHSFRNEQQTAYRLTQPIVTLPLPSTNAATRASENQGSYQLVRGNATWVPVQRIQGNTLRMQVPVGLEAPGFYQVKRAGRVVTTIAFNASSKESLLAPYSAAELRAMVGPGRNVHVIDSKGPAEAVVAQLQAEHNGQPLWRYFLCAALAFMLIEALLLRLGQPRTEAVTRPRATA